MQITGARNSRGFTLVESLISFVLFALAFVSIYAGITHAITSMRMARENLRATQIMTEKLDVIRLYNWERLNDPKYLPRTFALRYAPGGGGLNTSEGAIYQGQIFISNPPITANYGPRMKLVSVQLTWKTGSTQRSRSMSTLVAQDGLQSYVY
jgi:hypothetical protein